MKTLVFATNNPNKLEEVQTLLKDKFVIKGLKDIECHEDIPETADTLEGNASLKSKYVFETYGLDCFSDDTGLEVKALDMEPGVYSARYAGPQKNSEDNITKLLKQLANKNNRLARFRTVVSLILDGEEHLFEGIVNGTIAMQRKGESGFGYDPVFTPEDSDKTFAEMSQEAKNKISHRGLAIKKLVTFLENHN